PSSTKTIPCAGIRLPALSPNPFDQEVCLIRPSLFDLERQILGRGFAAIGVVDGEPKNVGARRRTADIELDVAHIVERRLARLEREFAEALLAREHFSVGCPDLEIDGELGGDLVAILLPGHADRLGIDDQRLALLETCIVARL